MFLFQRICSNYHITFLIDFIVMDAIFTLINFFTVENKFVQYQFPLKHGNIFGMTPMKLKKLFISSLVMH